MINVLLNEYDEIVERILTLMKLRVLHNLKSIYRDCARNGCRGVAGQLHPLEISE